jgi:SNF2 family DNA or RNA helicase
MKRISLESATQMLYPFQREGVAFLYERKYALIADDPGLGKTAQLIFAAWWLGARDVLILCPKTLVMNWKSELYKWSQLAGIPQSALNTWGVTNYEKLLLPRFEDKLSRPWSIVIADECHRAFKNWRTKKCKAFAELVYPNTQRVWFSTATLSTTSAIDYYPIFNFCMPNQWGKYWEFYERYCYKKPDGTFGGFRRHGELQKGFDYIGIKRKKFEVLHDLPDRVEIDIECGIDEKLFEQKLVEYNYNEHLSDAAYAHALGDAKVDAAISLMQELIPDDESFIFYCWHQSVVDEIAKRCEQLGHTTGVIRGGIPTASRWQTVEAFQAGKIKRLALNIQAGGEGLTLHAARYAMFVELPWSPTPYRQARDRIHRIGTKNAVTIYRLIADESDQIRLNTLTKRLFHIEKIEHNSLTVN